MKKFFVLVSIVILVIFAVLSKDTKYALIGCVMIVVIISTITFLECYKYYENKKGISNIYFTLKRDNLISQIINCALFPYFWFMDRLNNVLDASKEIEFFLSICMVTYAFIQLYIVLFHTPKLSTDGFLCSDGNFIFFNKIKSIKSENKPMLSCKKLTVEYEGNSQVFKVDDFDYEKIKNHIGMYGSHQIEETD